MDDPPVLTAGQLEALTLLADGLDINQIAARLSLSTAAVSRRITRAAGRLGTRTTAQTLLYADRRGLLPGSALRLFTLDQETTDD